MAAAMTSLLLATHNAHKTAEVRAILGPEFVVTDLTAWPGAPEPEETGSTFSANAALKALAASALAGPDTWVLADDSGLEVDALGGAPGVHSARYSGRHGDNPGHRAKLLDELARIGARGQERRGRFRCVLALARAGRVVAEFEGHVEGHIAPAERGAGGFGYDPLFIPLGHCATFGELPEAIKNDLSHRARALAALADSGLLGHG
jgi:XTP/dITP diphosphohydrolase